MTDYVQIRNPKTGLWVKVDRERGVIVSHKRTPGPYKNVPVAKPGSLGRVRPQ